MIRTLDEATWVATDGLRYMRPELVMAHKIRLARAKDDGDLEATLPLLDDGARVWLADYVARAAPGHRWSKLLR